MKKSVITSILAFLLAGWSTEGPATVTDRQSSRPELLPKKAPTPGKIYYDMEMIGHYDKF